jgi:hypothetical protein
MQPAEPGSAPGRIAALELMPGHPATEAEVWVWEGRRPEPGDDFGAWVVLRGDDWPMSPEVARELAAALLRAADHAEEWAPPSASVPTRFGRDERGAW